jgi:CRP/FNR family transcriptional regulator, cyclic AMP receptor protein
MRQFPDNHWFASMPAADVNALLAVAQPLLLKKGESTWRQGDAISGSVLSFFGLARGQVKASMLHPGGVESVLTIVEPGHWFGDVPILDPHPRHYTMEALVDSELLGITANDFMKLMQRATFAASVAKQIAIRTRLLYQIIAYAGLDTRTRVAHRLLMLAHGDGALLPVELTSIRTSQDILAMMLGISRPTLNKELHALAEAGAIAMRYGRIDITDRAQLQGIAHDVKVGSL